MRTVDGVVYESYVAVAVAMGLIESDGAWLACMDESALLDTPLELRYRHNTGDVPSRRTVGALPSE